MKRADAGLERRDGRITKMLRLNFLQGRHGHDKATDISICGMHRPTGCRLDGRPGNDGSVTKFSIHDFMTSKGGDRQTTADYLAEHGDASGVTSCHRVTGLGRKRMKPR